MARQLEHDRRGFHYVVALPRLFPEALDDEERFRIAVFPSPVEAMWQGRPVVASGIAELRSQVVDGEMGILLDSSRLVRC